MNSIRQIQELNKRELESGVSPEASWHTDYRDTAYIYIGGLPFELSEGDVIAIFSQFGEPTYINLVRDKETGKSKGFAFLKYEDQRSTDLAVDNLGGAVIMGRTLKVDHTRYKKKDGEPDEGIDLEEQSRQIEEDEGEGRRKRRRTSESESEEERPMIKEERELAKLMQEHDEDDPMKAFLIQEKKEESANTDIIVTITSHGQRMREKGIVIVGVHVTGKMAIEAGDRIPGTEKLILLYQIVMLKTLSAEAAKLTQKSCNIDNRLASLYLCILYVERLQASQEMYPILLPITP
ncbi:Zinc finger CCCH domain-containing protein [Lachnellula willkommii]|uniref:Zinc finger CCCH domain-containing protein n=1 Tax=Lachnellula willkommii TaxID=215461 RepID=A0A559MN50_9HELO|nr:Zinc finger CCCH domain-containing protein [Lachnellula willkommii]